MPTIIRIFKAIKRGVANCDGVLGLTPPPRVRRRRVSIPQTTEEAWAIDRENMRGDFARACERLEREAAAT